jgi:hypothetical protein
MPTPDPNFSNAYGIICDAMKDVGKLRAGGVPDSDTLSEYMRRLNKLINFYMTQGLKLWLIEDLSITLVAGQALYTLGPTGTIVMPKPLRVISGYYLDQTNNQRPLLPISYDEYKKLSQTTQQGALNSYMVDKQQLTLNVYFWLTPDNYAATHGTAHPIIEVPITNFTGVTDQMNFPIEWGLLLEWGLANQISTGQPQAIISRAFGMEAIYRQALEAWDVEDAATNFSPDQRIAQNYGKFR